MIGRDRRTCPRCDRDNADEPAIALSRREWTLRRCRACGFVYLENPPLRSDLEDGVFAWETNFDERDERMRREHPVSRSLTRLWRRTVRRLVPRPDTLGALTRRWVPLGLVVDVGCGGGGWLVRLAERYDVVGVEISAALAREAEGLLAARGGRVVNLPAVEGLAGLGAATASGVVMRSFLEHEHEPMALLRQARRVLRPDGALVVKVPNFACWNRRIMGPRWCGLRFPGHVNYFTPAGLAAMAGAAGLAPVRFGLLDRFSLSDNMWMVARPRDAARAPDPPAATGGP